MDVSLPPALTAFIEEQIKIGRYRAAEEVVIEGLCLLEEHERRTRHVFASATELESLLVHGIASGPPRLLTDSDWDDLHAIAKELSGRNES